jgi:flavin-dependent dehydrogenase
MDAMPTYPQTDCLVVGASFAGLACATVLARAGMRVTVSEKKADPGERLHTTGIIVKEAIDQVALLDGLPAELVRTAAGIVFFHHKGVFDPAGQTAPHPAAGLETEDTTLR